jgi:hypothetical protein
MQKVEGSNPFSRFVRLALRCRRRCSVPALASPVLGRVRFRSRRRREASRRSSRAPWMPPYALASSRCGGNAGRLLARPEGCRACRRLHRVLVRQAAAKIDHYIEEYLNGLPPEAPPPDFPISSQIDGELRELRVRFANTRYRLLYQRSGNLVVLLHAFEKHTGPRAGRREAGRPATNAGLQGANGRQAPGPATRRG